MAGNRTLSRREQYKQHIKKARTDFETFIKVVGRIKPAKHQPEWIRVCQKIADDPFGGHSYLIIAPPGSGKSQLIAVLFSAFMIGRYPNEHFGLISYADKVAWQRSIAVRNIIEKSPVYRRIFPKVLPDKTNWGTSGFQVQREDVADFHPSLRAGGSTSSIVSYRLSGVVIDDPHDPKNTSNPTQREKVYKNWEEAIRTRLLDGAWKLVITTRWADDDFAGTLLRKEKGDWEVITVLAQTPSGRSYWPERYSVEFLNKIKESNPETWAIQYMGDTTGGEGAIFKGLTTYRGEIHQREETFKVSTGRLDTFQNSFRYVHPKYGELDLLIAAGVDTATKDKEKNDYSVIYVGGLDQYGRIWILDRRKGRWMLPQLTEEIKSVYETFRPYNIWIEDAANGTPAVQTLQLECPYIPLELKTPTQGGKRPRWLSMQGAINNGQVLFPEDTEWFEDAQYYLMRVGKAAFDDDADALYQLLKNLMEIRHPSQFYADGRLKATLNVS